MSATEFGIRIKSTFMLTLFTGLCGLTETIFTSIIRHRFTGVPLFSLIILAEGIVFWLAFKSDSLEKALKQIGRLRIISLILVAYATFSLVMYFIRIVGVRFNLFQIWFEIIFNLSAALASLAIFFTATTLKTGDMKKFKIAGNTIHIIEVVLVFCVSVAALSVAELLIPAIMILFIFFILLPLVSKMLGNKIIKGAIAGAIIAGDVGAVVGAIAASKSDKK